MVEKIAAFFQKLFCGSKNLELEELKNELDMTKEQLQKARLESHQYEETIDSLQEQVVILSAEKLAIVEERDEFVLEYFWNHKIRPVTMIFYPARNRKNMNVLEFLSKNNDVPIVPGGNHDEIAENALRWVINHVEYVSDKTQHGLAEQWQWADETLESEKGDCEDGAILMANIMIASGVPYWRVRLNAGDVQGGGHAYVTYLREQDNAWYILDWCYWPNESIGFKKTWKSAEKYFSPVWFSWNRKYGFQKDELDR